MATIPSIACLGVIGKNNNPLHISTFPNHDPSSPKTQKLTRTPLQYALLLSSTLDIFDARRAKSTVTNTALTGDLGLLYAVDERLAAYGYETNTGVRFVAFVDMRGRVVREGRGDVAGNVGKEGAGVGGNGMGGAGIREADVKGVFRAMQAAYIRLLQNPFYDPDEHSPVDGRGGKKITSRKFLEEMRRIGEGWVPGGVGAV